MSPLGNKQRHFLNLVADACVPHEMEPNGPKEVIPFYTGRQTALFESVADERRFLENLESRGLVRVEKIRFVYITPAGLEAIGRKPIDQVKTSAQPEDASGEVVDGGVVSASYAEGIRKAMLCEPQTLVIGGSPLPSAQVVAPQARWEPTGDTVVTMEDPAEILLPLAVQLPISVEGADGVESTRFADEIRRFMRCEPQTLVIGGSRPQEKIPPERDEEGVEAGDAQD